jgi:hypothetical protein
VDFVSGAFDSIRVEVLALQAESHITARVTKMAITIFVKICISATLGGSQPDYTSVISMDM